MTDLGSSDHLTVGIVGDHSVVTGHDGPGGKVLILIYIYSEDHVDDGGGHVFSTVSIGDHAFFDSSGVPHIIISDTVDRIEVNAFSDCPGSRVVHNGSDVDYDSGSDVEVIRS